MLQANLIKYVKSGKMSSKDAVNFLCRFINENYPIYGKELNDEDFREEIILSVLENGEKLLSNYDEKRSDFFGYFYCYIRSLIQTKKRALAKKYMVESIAISESINDYEGKIYKYQNIDYSCFDVPKIPYSQKKITQEELQNIFKNVKGDKTLLVLSIKSIFYITDPIIRNICSYYNLKESEFYSTIQYCKEMLLPKETRKRQMVERRNYAYYHHRQYETKLILLNDKDDTFENIILKNILKRKDSRQMENFSKLNNKINKGIIFVRPTNKVIASILGICERQVEYYLICAKKKYMDYLNIFASELDDDKEQ